MDDNKSDGNTSAAQSLVHKKLTEWNLAEYIDDFDRKCNSLLKEHLIISILILILVH